MSALSAIIAGRRYGGAVYGEARDDARDTVLDYLETEDIPRARALLWAASLEGKRLDTSTLEPGLRGLTLDPYQRAAVAHLTPAGGLISMDPGLGKTVTAVCAARCWARQYPGATRCWIVGPLNAEGAWVPYLPYLREVFPDVRYISMDSVHHFSACPGASGIIIADECHGFGSRDTRRTKHAMSVRLGTTACFALTGTPVHGGFTKAFSQLDLAIPGAAQFATQWRAGEFYGAAYMKDVGRPRPVRAYKQPEGSHKVAFLDHLKFYATMFSFASREVAEVIRAPTQDCHQFAVAEPWMPAHLEAATAAAEIMATNGGEVPHFSAIAHALARRGTGTKLQWFDEAWDDRTDPVVTFAQYRETLDAITAWADERGVTYVRVDGDVIADARIEAVRKFQAGEVQLFIGQATAAAVAIDLFRARMSVMFDHPWSCAAYAQAKARTARRGQLRHCVHIDLCANAFQSKVISQLRAGEDFHAEAVRHELTIDTPPHAIVSYGIPRQPASL